jgi:hypothetical protein
VCDTQECCVRIIHKYMHIICMGLSNVDRGMEISKGIVMGSRRREYVLNANFNTPSNSYIHENVA